MNILLDAAQVSKRGNDHQAAHEAAGQMAADPRDYRVSPRHPCPICGHNKWCLYDQITGTVLCGRESRGSLLNRDGRPIRLGEYGYLHARGVNSLYIGGPVPSTQHARRNKNRNVTPPETLRLIATMWATAAQDRLPEAAVELGLPVGSLAAFGLGYVGGCWTWVERSATGEIVGIGTRKQGSGSKSFRSGGRRGIILSTAHAADLGKLRNDIISRDFVLLCEGFTDTAAAHAMGVPAVGRYSVSGGVEELAALLQALDLSDTVQVIVAGENDQRPDGTWPGRDDAQAAADKLSELLGRPVQLLMPPPGVKDLRQAWQAGITTWGEYAKRGSRPADRWAGLEADALRMGCGWVALSQFAGNRPKDYTGQTGQRNQSARHPQYIRMVADSSRVIPDEPKRLPASTVDRRRAGRQPSLDRRDVQPA